MKRETPETPRNGRTKRVFQVFLLRGKHIEPAGYPEEAEHYAIEFGHVLANAYRGEHYVVLSVPTWLN